MRVSSYNSCTLSSQYKIVRHCRQLLGDSGFLFPGQHSKLCKHVFQTRHVFCFFFLFFFFFVFFFYLNFVKIITSVYFVFFLHHYYDFVTNKALQTKHMILCYSRLGGGGGRERERERENQLLCFFKICFLCTIIGRLGIPGKKVRKRLRSLAESHS